MNPLRSIKRLVRRDPVVPVIRMSGVIGAATPLRQGLSIASLANTLDRAFSMGGRAVAIQVNSPGGSAVQSRLIYQRIRDLAREKNVRVYMFAEDVAASGGYMIMCAGDEIYADSSSIIGSIGVIYAGFGFSDFYANASGDDEFFGYVAGGAVISMPLTFLNDAGYGTWTVSAGGYVYYFGPGVRDFNKGAGGDSQWDLVGNVSIGVAF